MIRLRVEHLPSGGSNKPVWLWWSGTGATAADVDRSGRHSSDASTSSTLSACSSRPSAGPAPKIRSPEAADRWTWLIVAAYTQLRLARRWPPTSAALGTADRPNRLTPARVRRGFQKKPARRKTGRLSHGSCRVKVKSASWGCG